MASNSGLGEGWGWFIMFLALCLFVQCNRNDTLDSKVNDLERDIRSLKSDIHQLELENKQ